MKNWEKEKTRVSGLLGKASSLKTPEIGAQKETFYKPTLNDIFTSPKKSLDADFLKMRIMPEKMPELPPWANKDGQIEFELPVGTIEERPKKMEFFMLKYLL